MTTEVKKENTALTLALEGELNTLEAPKFEEAYQNNKAGMKSVTIDMQKLTYITSAGLRVLLVIQQEMEAEGGSLTVCHVSEEIRKVFEVTGFSSFLTIL